MKNLSLLLIAMIFSFAGFSQTPITGPSSTCVGASTTYSDGVSGGLWSTSTVAVATIGSATGILYGVAAGVVTITYTVPPSSSVYKVVTVNPLPLPITGPSTVCIASGITLADASPGGIWSSSNVVIATISAGGTAYGVTAGTAVITYALTATGCLTTHPVTVNPSPVVYTVTGGGAYCAGGTGVHVGLSGSSPGVNYQLYLGAVAVGLPFPGTGGVIDFGLFTAAGVYTVSGAATCAAAMSGSATVTVDALPTVTASASAVGCDGSYTLTGGGASTYTWAPGSGLSCTACGSPSSNPSATTTYTVTGTDGAGCINTGTVSVNGDRIMGTVSPTVAGTIRVWLVEFNPADSSITALDSTTTCTSGGTQYYEFATPATGDYMVKAYLLGGTAGASGYIPTYSSSAAHWNTAATVTHASATDNMNVTMIYGTVPSGPGFISGYVASGAGRGTSGEIPVQGMLIYLLDATSGNVITYTYTNAAGNYTFNSIANGTYKIYPEYYQYATTPSAVVTLTSALEHANGIDFKQHTTSRTITPYVYTTIVKPVSVATGINVFPNPASDYVNIQWNDQVAGVADVVITDVVGRQVYISTINIGTAAGQSEISTDGLKNGIYTISINNQNIRYSGKIAIAH